MVSIHLQRLPHPGAYARAWRQLKELLRDDPQQYITAKAIGYWASAPVTWIAADFRRAFQRRINERGGLQLHACSEARIHRLSIRHGIRHQCRWCGTDIGYVPQLHQRFCSADCWKSYSR